MKNTMKIRVETMYQDKKTENKPYTGHEPGFDDIVFELPFDDQGNLDISPIFNYVLRMQEQAKHSKPGLKVATRVSLGNHIDYRLDNKGMLADMHFPYDLDQGLIKWMYRVPTRWCDDEPSMEKIEEFFEKFGQHKGNDVLIY